MDYESYRPASVEDLLGGRFRGEPVEIEGEAAGIVWTSYRAFNAGLRREGLTLRLWGAEDRSNGARAIRLFRDCSENGGVVSVGGVLHPGSSDFRVHYVRLEGTVEHCMSDY